MIKYFVNEEKNKVTAYFYDNSDYRGKALWGIVTGKQIGRAHV